MESKIEGRPQERKGRIEERKGDQRNERTEKGKRLRVEKMGRVNRKVKLRQTTGRKKMWSSILRRKVTKAEELSIPKEG